MPPVKGEKLPNSTQNTSAQIQQIFAEVQSQLPSVNFDTDDLNDEGDNNELLESPMVDNTDALLDSLSNRNTYSFLTIHPRIDAPQQPPSVELQMRLSPNPFEASTSNQNSPPKSSILSMDLFNSIDFDKLPANVAAASPPSLPSCVSLVRTFHRPRPIPTPHQQLFSQEAANMKNRDDRQILERLAQQANQFSSNGRSPPSAMHDRPLRNLESALYGAVNEQYNRHGKRVGVLESERKTIFIDLRHSQAPKQDEQPSMPRIEPLIEQKATSESESDDDDEDNRNDGMLWFEKRRLAKQQQLNSGKQ